MKKIKSALAKISSWLLYLSGFASLVEVSFQVMDIFHDDNPTLEMFFNGKGVESGDNREIVICVDDTVDASPMNELFPVFKNSTRYSAKDFAMVYNLTTSGLSIDPKTGEFNLSSDGDGSYTLKYNENTLPAHFYVKEPIRKLKVTGETGSMNMEAYATYDGVPEPYSYHAFARFFYVNSDGLHYDEWKLACNNLLTKSAQDKCIDVLYASAKYDKEFVFDRNVTSIRSRIDASKGYAARGAWGRGAQAQADGVRYGVTASEKQYRVTAPHVLEELSVVSYKRREHPDVADSLEVVVVNGFNNDTTVVVSVEFRNTETGQTQTTFSEKDLKVGNNFLLFPIAGGLSYVSCTFSKPGQDLQPGNEDAQESESAMHPVVYAILMLILGAVLIAAGYQLRRRSNERDITQQG